MDRKHTSLLALIIALFGIILLAFFSPTIKAQKISIDEINNEHLGKYIELQGTLHNITSHNGNLQADLCTATLLEKGLHPKTCINLAIFAQLGSEMRTSGFDIYSLIENDKIKVLGTIHIYKQQFEILPLKANSIERVD